MRVVAALLPGNSDSIYFSLYYRLRCKCDCLRKIFRNVVGFSSLSVKGSFGCSCQRVPKRKESNGFSDGILSG